MSRAVFIDRDGTLNEMVYDESHGTMDSPRRPEQVVMAPHAGAFLKALKELGFLRIVVTNQPGIAKGTLTLHQLDKVNKRLSDLLAEEGGEWDDLFFSPYHPDPGPGAVDEYVRDSECRKPGPGMLLEAAEKHDVDLAASWMIGDGLVDIQAGRRAGCRTILLTRLKLETVTKFFDLEQAQPDVICSSLMEAAEVIGKSVTVTEKQSPQAERPE